MMPRKLERDFLSSNAASVNTLMEHAPIRSLARLSLESLRDEFATSLDRLAATPGEKASTALFFNGKPVSGSRGIESEFASSALWHYQDIVTKLFALKSKGQLGERGVIAEKDRSRLHVTNLVHGSFGFLLEDVSGSDDATTAPLLKDAADDSARLLGTFAEEDELRYENAIEDINDRVLQPVKEFFDTLAKHSATVRIVSGDSERSFDSRGIARAADRAKTTKMEEAPEHLDGYLQGIMQDKREFELRVGGRIITGKIRGDVPVEAFQNLYHRNVSGDFARTDVFRGGTLVRQKYTLIAIKAQESTSSTSYRSSENV